MIVSDMIAKIAKSRENLAALRTSLYFFRSLKFAIRHIKIVRNMQ